MEMDGLDQRSRGVPADRGHCFSCMVALVAAMALIILALVLGFIFYIVVVTPSCKQATEPVRPAERVNFTTNLNESGEKGRFDIFTVDKAATYLIYGWVNLTHINSKEIILRNTFKGDSITLEEKKAGSEVFFFQKVKLVDDSRISIYFNATCTDNLFHVLEV